MNDLFVTVAALSDIGRRRSKNEDAFAVADLDDVFEWTKECRARSFKLSDKGVLLAVSDGMGGHRAGDVASLVALDSLQAALRGKRGDVCEKRLESAVTSANAAVIDAARDKNRAGMGATLTAVVLTTREALIAEVGDSRAYLLRGGKLRQLTRDQSLVQMLVDAGAMSAEQAKDSPRRNIVVQAIGRQEKMCVALGRLQLRRGDKIFLCSDGLWDSMTDAEMAQVLANNDAAAACTALIDLANERGGADNITAVVAELGGEDLASLGQAESLTGTFEVLKEFAG
jgi:PPM family protein phosphatase